jgi:hypothetical protein
VSLLLIEGDEDLVFRSEKKSGVPSGPGALGRRGNGWLDLVLSILWTRAHARAFRPLNSVNSYAICNYEI